MTDSDRVDLPKIEVLTLGNFGTWSRRSENYLTARDLHKTIEKDTRTTPAIARTETSAAVPARTVYTGKAVETDAKTKDHGITLEMTPGYTPEQDGVAEQFMRTLGEASRTNLCQSGLPP